MTFTSASNPSYDGRVAHLRCKAEDIAPVVLLPGDPGRVEFFFDLCDDFEIRSRNREFVVGKGRYRDMPIAICSTGIGAPSTEIAVSELIDLGAKALIRIGGSGAIQEDIQCGDMILNTAAVRQGGASRFYAEPEYPAVAAFAIVAALREACLARQATFHMGICASVGSFFAGQGRQLAHVEKTFQREEDVLAHYQALNVLNLEMETETIFTLASIYGVDAGSICVTHCNRVNDQWLIDFESAQKQMCSLALEGAYTYYLAQK